MLLIGLDAASQLSNFGFAIGSVESDKVSIKEAGIIGDDEYAIEDMIANHLRDADRAVVAIDAPLGWPAALGNALVPHAAGDNLSVEKNSLFKRNTDKTVRSVTGKNPLEIGADKIARATHTALEVLNRLRKKSRLTLPLLWSTEFSGAGVIEVYPGATLKMHGAPSSAYKKPDEKAARDAIVKCVGGTIPDLKRYVSAKADVFDACLCVLAAHDFMMGSCRSPAQDELEDARKEGWIWVRWSSGSAEVITK